MRDGASRVWRAAASWRGDALLGLAVMVFLVAFMAVRDQLSANLAATGCAAIICCCLPFRRDHPQWAAAASGVLLGAIGVAQSSPNTPFGLLFVLVFLFAYSLGAGAKLGWSVLALLVLGAGLEVAQLPAELNPLVLVVAVGPWLVGLVVGSRRQLSEQLALRASELAAERELFVAESVRYERARIARELHDIVAHCVTVMVIQAGAGQRFDVADQAMIAQTFDSIGEAARTAQAEISRLVELLDTGPGARGAGGLAAIEELVARSAAAGLHVTCRLAGSADDLAPDVAETAYRLVQESLTNALRHAPGAPVEIAVRACAGDVEISVRNDPAPARKSGLEQAGGGRGLAGMRERVAGCGGDLRAGVTPAGGWEVLASLPRPTRLARLTA